MAKLSKEQLRFLAKHRISPSQIIDGSGLTPIERKTAMGAIGASFYYGGAPCKEKGHTLRSKPGHCIECKTERIAFQMRSQASGHIYLAYSETQRHVKIGVTSTDPGSRILSLRRDNYGNSFDWVLKKSEHVAVGAGECEFKIHQLLKRHQSPLIYERLPGKFVECRELFSCSLVTAKRALSEALGTVCINPGQA